MWWIAALLSAIVWVLAWSSGFLGPVAHVFLLLAFLALVAQALGMLAASETTEEVEPSDEGRVLTAAATGDVEQATAEAGDEEGRDSAG
jgi:Na+-transporting methylmalonyl-CoA/oxaloacetate decarboxylase gamma subunit